MKPILFNTEMVRAILDGRKTSTRRVVKPQPPATSYVQCTDGKLSWAFWQDGYGHWVKSPYSVGDILYVRETWQFIPCIDCGAYLDNMCSFKPVVYEDKYSVSEGCFIYREDCVDEKRVVWHPSIHMPKEAARIFLRVKDVRVERLWEISEREARKEGAVPLSFSTDPEETPESERKWVEVGAAVHDFIRIWNETMRKEDREKFGWDANPWVWVIEFERCEKPEVESRG